MTYQTEQELEELLIEQLKKQGYERVTINDEEQLKSNFRKQLNLFNKEKLKGIDAIIEEEKGKLEDLRQWKKGLLQQMFV